MYNFVNKYSNTYDDIDLKRNNPFDDSVIIVDEAHNLRTDVHRKVKGKNTGTRTSAIIECAKNAWKVLLLTATPVYNSPYDMVNLVSMIKGIEPITKKQFESKILHNDTEFRKFFSCVIY